MIIRNRALSMLILLPGIAIAQEPPPDSLTVGAAAEYAPRYSGDNHNTWSGVPVVQARHGAFFFDTEKGLGYDLQTDNGLWFEHSLGVSLGRGEKNSAWREGANSLKGMGNIKTALNTRLALGWSVTPWLTLEGQATLPLTDSQGVQYQTSFTLVPFQSEADTLALESAALFGDRRYLNTFYGVDAQQSARSGYTPYRTSGGFYGVSNNLSWSHQFDAHWGATLSAGYTWLADKADNSPIVHTRNQTTTALAVTYTF
ncbi:MipA/OmpV family protein [Cronobacter sakazakii]|uniref:MipA/OmpV family protein n=1 Tax=Cronobacter sakazakii TaxID=28141 RepID=UPI0011E427D5|nr:MipA/OmpV family protein [Cronobacter sakazakii]MDT3611693.1 MipA/OmpV family protein [Cronobacter sakazakii]QWR82973.1 MipA/OmpV family protein [Cronobacter sakazakii]TYD48895.1 MipA/OmpV family protein [Cronobacter sakazakii]